MTIEPPNSPVTQAKDKYQIDFNALRRLRAELQQLQGTLQTVAKGQARLEACDAYIKRTVRDIEEVVKEIEEKEKQSRQYSDDIRHILNVWEQMQDSPLLSPQPGKSLDAQELTHALSIFDAQFKDIIFEIGFLTIPDRLNRWLEQTTPGHYVPFHDVFENEMPDYGDRVKLLNLLAWAPKVAAVNGGLVEPETGLVYRYEPDDGIRRTGNFFLMGVIVAVTGIVAALAYVPLEGWPLGPKNLVALLAGWVAVVIGVIVHIGIDVAKQQQKTARPPVIAFNDLPLLINAKFGQVMLKIMLSLVGFVGLVFAVGIENAQPINAFFVGYSLDSFIGVLSAGIEQKGAAQLATLKQQLGVTDKS